MRRFLAAMTLAGGAQLTAAEPDELVRRLADPSFAVRDAAAKDLLKLGGAALPALQAARDTSDLPALRERAEAILPRLERLAESERVLSPTRLKLDYREIPLSQAVADLKSRTGIPLQLIPENVANPARPVSLAGEFAPWEAIEKLCAAAGLKEDHRAELPLPKGAAENPNLNIYSSQPVYFGSPGPQTAFYSPSTAPVLLVDGQSAPLAGVRDKTIRVLMLPAGHSANRVVRGAGTVVAHLDVAPLPKLNWAGANRVRVTRAEDEDGRPIFADQRTAAAMPNASPYSALQWRGGGIWIEDGTAGILPINSAAHNPRLTPLTLRTDDRAIKTLRRLEGIVVGDVRRPNETIIEISDIQAGVGQVHEGPYQLKLAITGYTAAASGAVTVKVRAELPQLWAIAGAGANRDPVLAQELNIGTIQNRLAFHDAAGKRCKAPQQRRSSYSGNNWSQSYETELHFPPTDPPVAGAGPPVKVVLTGTKLATIEIPFSMENVRLP